MKNQEIKSIKELEKKLSIEKLEDRLEMVQIAIVASKAQAAEKNNCICGGDDNNDNGGGNDTIKQNKL